MEGPRFASTWQAIFAREDRRFVDPLVVGLLLLAACLFGIATRPVGFLAAMWPANALLLGLMVRTPRLATLPCWLAAAVAYVLADLLTGGEWLPTILLTAGNLVGVVVGYALFQRFDVEDRRLQRSGSILKLAMLATIASAAEGCAGALIDPILFNGEMTSGWSMWFTSELVNFIAILPLVLSLPQRQPVAWVMREARPHLTLHRALPAVALLASCAASFVVGGPGAIAFPVPALLWCALAYSTPIVSLFTLLFYVWTMVAIVQGVFDLQVDFNSRNTLLSIRLGITLIALAPLTIASAMTEHKKLLTEFRHLAMHDALTGALSRGAFTEGCETLVQKRDGASTPLALLVLDIDNFKSINDTHGHAAGDSVLIHFANTTRHCLRETDLFGRIGGEEFAILLPRCSRAVATAIAERIRQGFAEAETPIDGGFVAATVSIGIVCATAPPKSFTALLRQSDKALYRAKSSGRNRVELAEMMIDPARLDQADFLPVPRGEIS